jgi:hypothetical protein
MINASYYGYAPAVNRLMMNKSLRGYGEESSGKGFYGFRAVGNCQEATLRVPSKKKPPFSGGL